MLHVATLVAACVLASSAGGAASGASEQGPGSGAGSEQRSERGPVSALVRVEPDRVRIGDPVTLTIEVTAAADVELLMPVFGASLERYRILEFVPRERIDEAGRTVSTQRYQLQPMTSGQHTLPPITIEFVDRRAGQRPAPEGEDAYELLTERLSFVVESVVPAGAGDDLKPPLGPLDPILAERTRSWPWIATGAGFVVLAGIAAVVAGRRRRAPRLSAYALALKRLGALEARPRPEPEGMDAFFVELSDIVRRYLEERFSLHAPELTTEEFLDVAAASPDLTRDHRSFLQSFLRRADQVKFARHIPDVTAVEAVLAQVRGFLGQTGEREPQGGDHTVRAAREAIHG